MIKVFAGLLAIMVPIANVPVFPALTEGASPAAQRRVTATAAVGTVVGCLVSVLAGRLILTFGGRPGCSCC